MDDFIAYLDTSEVHAGRLEELKAAMSELAAFLELNEPRIFAYRVYFSTDGSTMSVLHFHPGCGVIGVPHAGGRPQVPAHCSVRQAEVD